MQALGLTENESTAMDHKELIIEALRRSSDEIPYFVSRQLTRLFADKAVLYCGSEYLDITAYAKAGLCEMVCETRVFNQSEARWKGRKKGIEHEPENAWINVMWNGHLLDVILISWGGHSRYRRHWIIAESRELAE